MTMTGGGLGIAHLADIESIDLGGPGDLYAATDLKLDRQVAVRVLPALADDAARSRFNHESRVLGLLSSHPNVVTVYDAGFTEQGRPFLVLELVEGTTLADRLEEQGPLPWPEAVDLTLQICAGLAEAHRAGALHGDLRPENVFVAGPSVKLGDLGLLSFEPAMSDGAGLDHLLHQAPEAADGHRDARTDLYSLASILHHLIDGRPPFWRPDDSVEALLARLRTQPAPPLDPDVVPESIRVFVSAGLSKDPIDRPQSADEFARELDLIRRGRTTGSTPSVLHGTTVSMPVVAAPSSAGPVPSPNPTVPATRAPLPQPPRVDPPATAPVPAGLSVPTAAATTVAAPPRPRIEAPATSRVPAGSVPSELWAPPTSAPSSTSTPTSTIAELRAGVLAGGERTAVHPVQPSADRTAIHETVPVSAWPAVTTIDDGPDPLAPAGPVPPPPDPTPAPTAPTLHSPALLSPDRAETPIRRTLFDVDRSPAFLAAMAMIALGLVGLMGLAAFGLLRSDDSNDVATPSLPGDEAAVDAGGVESGSSTTLTPLAMLPSSTTTTIPSEDMLSTTSTKPQVTVPNLVGMTVERAGGLLSDAGFQVLVVGRVSPGAVPGTVTQQVPAGGSVATLPLTVTLYIPRSSSMPAVVGRPAETVCLQLTALGLRCEQTMQFDDQVPAGAVIASDPVEGAGFSDGDTVRLQVSRGPRVDVNVPEVGRRSEAEARQILTEAGFLTIATLAQPSESVQEGQAIGTTPAAGSTVPIDEPITILVSSGPAPRVNVPELMGADRATAEARLTQTGLTATFLTQDLPDGDPGIGKVVAVDPAQGSEVLAGTAITVTIGQRMSATTSTTAPAG